MFRENVAKKYSVGAREVNFSKKINTNRKPH